MTEAEIKLTKTRSAELILANDCIYVNAAALKMFVKSETVMICFNTGNRKLILRPCRDGEYEAVRWRSGGTDSVISRHIRSHDLAGRIFALINQPRENRYIIVGSIAESGGEQVLLFDLTAAVSYIPAKANTNKSTQEET
jgi:hypothetical protein